MDEESIANRVVSKLVDVVGLVALFAVIFLLIAEFIRWLFT